MTDLNRKITQSVLHRTIPEVGDSSTIGLSSNWVDHNGNQIISHAGDSFVFIEQSTIYPVSLSRKLGPSVLHIKKVK